MLLLHLGGKTILPGKRLCHNIQAGNSLVTLRKYLAAKVANAYNLLMWKVLRRSRATLAVVEGRDVPEIQKDGQWSS